MGKEIHPQEGDQIRKGPLESGAKLEESKNQHGNQCGPNLNLYRVRTGPHKGFDLEVLFQGPEEGLNLPAVFIDGRDGGSP